MSSCRGFVPISPKGGSGCRPEVPDGRQLSGHTPRLTALTTATSLDMASIDALKPLGSVVFPPLIDLRHHHLPLPHNHTPTTASPHGTSGQPPHLRSLSHEHPWCGFASWGGLSGLCAFRFPGLRGTAPTAHARATGRTGWAAADTWSVCVAAGRTHDDSRCMRHRQEAAPSVCGT